MLCIKAEIKMMHRIFDLHVSKFIFQNLLEAEAKIFSINIQFTPVRSHFGILRVTLVLLHLFYFLFDTFSLNFVYTFYNKK